MKNPLFRTYEPSDYRTFGLESSHHPADMSIFCNLQLGLLELQEDMPHTDIEQDNVSLAGVLQGAVGRTVDTPVFARAVVGR